MILGIAVPGVLGVMNVLFSWSCILVVAILAIVRTIKVPPKPPTLKHPASFDWQVLPMLTILANGWPALVRPLLDGDSLSYHLPNAASWVHAHGLWVTTTRYWWYPGGSELFAAGLFAVAGPFGLPTCGLLASLLLAVRCFRFARKAKLNGFAAGALSSAVMSAHTLQVQEANLGNDLWLTAMLLEMVWCARYEREALSRTSLIASLIKPIGFVFALALQAFSRLPSRSRAFALAGIALWAIRDAALWARATIPVEPSGKIWTTTIAWHNLIGLRTLASAIAADGVLFSLLCFALVGTLAFGNDRLLRSAAAVFFMLFLFEPFGYSSNAPLLANGSSLRFALPALVFGFVGLFGRLQKTQNVVAVILLALVVRSAVEFQSIFHADASTSGVGAALLIATVTLLIPNSSLRRLGGALVAMAFVAYAGRIAAIHPAEYYDDELTMGGKRSHLLTWVENVRPSAVVGYLLPLGQVAVVSPSTVGIDGVDAGSCSLARENRALLLTAGEPGLPASIVARARSQTAACGAIRFSGPNALAVEPSRHALPSGQL